MLLASLCLNKPTTARSNQKIHITKTNLDSRLRFAEPPKFQAFGQGVRLRRAGEFRDLRFETCSGD